MEKKTKLFLPPTSTITEKQKKNKKGQYKQKSHQTPPSPILQQHPLTAKTPFTPPITRPRKLHTDRRTIGNPWLGHHLFHSLFFKTAKKKTPHRAPPLHQSPHKLPTVERLVVIRTSHQHKTSSNTTNSETPSRRRALPCSD